MAGEARARMIRAEAALRALRRKRADGGVEVAVRPGVSHADLGAAFGVSAEAVGRIVGRLEADPWYPAEPLAESGG